jgi:transposase
VRAVLYFNPQLFVDQRLRARELLASIQSFTDDLNARLASPRARMQRDQISAAIDRRLRKDNLIDAFTPLITEQQIAGRTRFAVQLQLDSAQWSRRRRHDGFNVIVAHPNLDRSATELCRLYRAKDAVEKDFQTIKSLVELRPVRHQTDPKVRAHVTLCMLSLLLQRSLEHRLKGLHSAKAALELLAPTHLNRYESSTGTFTHVVTRTDASQNKILRCLRLQHLADHQPIFERAAPVG